MKAQESLFPIEDREASCEGVSSERVVVTNVRHSHYGISLVELNHNGSIHFVVLITDDLDLEAADKLCADVPLWWDPSLNPSYLY